MIKKYDNYIGIDPDVTLSGVAFLETKTKKLEVSALSFFQLFGYLKNVFTARDESKQTIQIVIESGWENKSNWHLVPGQKSSVSALIGSKVGANHQIGKLIVEMCEYLELDYKLIRPTTQKWNKSFCEKVTKIDLSIIPGVNRQECIDAIKLIWR